MKPAIYVCTRCGESARASYLARIGQPVPETAKCNKCGGELVDPDKAVED